MHWDASLALGPALGGLRAFVDKQRALHSKHSFSFCIAVGDFFAPLSTSQADQDVDDLLAGTLDGMHPSSCSLPLSLSALFLGR